MSYWVYVTLSCHNWKSNDFRYSGACFIYQFCVLHKYVLVGYSRHKKKTTFIGGMELVSLRCNRDFTSASSYGLGWYKYAIATQWYQFHTTDAWWFSLITTDTLVICCKYGCKFSLLNRLHIFQYMHKIVCAKFQRMPMKFHTKHHTHTLKDAAAWQVIAPTVFCLM